MHFPVLSTHFAQNAIINLIPMEHLTMKLPSVIDARNRSPISTRTISRLFWQQTTNRQYIAHAPTISSKCYCQTCNKSAMTNTSRINQQSSLCYETSAEKDNLHWISPMSSLMHVVLKNEHKAYETTFLLHISYTRYLFNTLFTLWTTHYFIILPNFICNWYFWVQNQTP